MNKVIEYDMKKLVLSNPVWRELNNCTVMVTGATGLIGKQIVYSMLKAIKELGISIQIIVFVRNQDKAKALFSDLYYGDCITFYQGNIMDEIKVDGQVDYIIHCASCTDSRDFVEKPVETILTGMNGTEYMLKLARQKKVRSMVYLSSMEVYGFVRERKVLRETDSEYLNCLAVRSSYPQSKRMAENLCVAYANEYGVPVKIIRLAQTFGAGVDRDDSRVFAELARCAVEKKNIKLLTDGTSERMYLYTADAVNAIFTILLCGESGQAYNAANQESYCSIVDMAELVKGQLADNLISIEFSDVGTESEKFSPPHFIYMDTTKLEMLGWNPEHSLLDMFQRMILSWKE